VTSKFPREELYGLTNQMRRSSVSISANIAEGCGRRGDAELARFFQIAMGSATELECYLLLSYELKFIDGNDYKQLENRLFDIKRMLASFLKLSADR
jgi:four helix bundle protein